MIYFCSFLKSKNCEYEAFAVNLSDEIFLQRAFLELDFKNLLTRIQQMHGSVCVYFINTKEGDFYTKFC
jgi:hypothetical protein